MSLLAPALAWAQSADSDGDGATDAADAFPCDASAAAVSFAPSSSTYGGLLFEDAWPAAGDLDFNDVVLAYNAAVFTNASGATTRVRYTVEVLSTNGHTPFGLGVQLPAARTAITSATLAIDGGAASARTANAADAQATFFLVDDLHDGTARLVLDVRFSPAVSGFSAATAPWDTFVFESTDVTREIHRSPYRGTARNDQRRLGTADDATNATRSYVERSGLPFSLTVAGPIAWSREWTELTSVYPRLLTFAQSGGSSATSWYTDAPVSPDPAATARIGAIVAPAQISADTSCLNNSTPIVCTHQGSVTGSSNHQIAWTAAECGGALPGTNHVGMLSWAHQCGLDEDWQAVNANEGAPGMTFWTGGSSDCGSNAWRAVYIERGPGVIVCRHEESGTLPTSGSTRLFTAAECGGTLPGTNYVGVLAKASQCGDDEDWAALDASEGGPGVRTWMQSSCAGGRWEVVYLDRTHPRFAGMKVCAYAPAGLTVADDAEYLHRFTTAQCGGVAPTADDVPLLAHATSCGRDEDWRALGTTEGGPGVNFRMVTGACAGQDFKVVYLPRRAAAQSCSGSECTAPTFRTCAYASPSVGAGSSTHVFTAAECGGTLPTTGTRAVLVSAAQCGRDEDWQAYYPGESSGPGVSMWMTGASCSQGNNLWSASYFTPGAATIVCRANVTFTPAMGRNRRHFTAAECGGTLPGPNHVGLLAKASHCGEDEDWTALDARNGGAGMEFWVRSLCAGGTEEVVYVDLSHPRYAGAIVCEHTSNRAPPAGAYSTYRFTADECGGVLPDATYQPILSRTQQCGTDEDWRALGAADGGAGVSLWMTDTCAGADYRVVYLPRGS